MHNSSISLIAAWALATILGACKREETFPDLGTSVASPVDVDASASGGHFYVLNSDFDRTYNRGSILILSADGEKIGAVETPRMGRSLRVAGDYLLVSFDVQDDDAGAEVRLYDISDETQPRILQRHGITACHPWNVMLTEASDYFFVTCSGGSLFLGSKSGDVSFRRVRRYRYPRRALHFDTTRNLLFVFPTAVDVNKSESDQVYTDTKSSDAQADIESEDPNEIPDVFEWILFGSGKLIFKPGGMRGEKADVLIVDNVYRVNSAEARVKRYLGTLRVDDPDTP